MDSGVHGPHTPLSMESAVAVPVICQLSVTVVPATIVLGDALRLSVIGTATVVILGTAVPPGPAALMVNVVVDITATTEDPEVGSEPVSLVCGTGGVIVTDVAFAVAQVMVVVWPPFTLVGLAVNTVICG